MRMRRILSVVLVLVLVVGLLPILGAAAADDTMTLSVSSANSMPGKTIQVEVLLSNNPGVASLKFAVDYDSALTLTDVKFGSAFKDAMITAPRPYADPQTITLISPFGDNKANGVLATLTFLVAENAPDAYAAKINITYNSKDVFNTAGAKLEMAAESGDIIIFRKLAGDINADGKVNTKDANDSFRYVAGWDIAVDEEALDVNGDGSVDTMDAITMFRYTAGWQGIILYRGELKHLHNYIYKEAVAPSCTEPGNIAYYYCDVCGVCFADAEGSKELTSDEVTVLATGHGAALQHFAAKAPTADADGYEEYWQCATCKKYYSDAAAVNEILEPVAVPFGPSYAVTFVDPKNWTSGHTQKFSQAETLILDTIVPPAVDGYKFVGWSEQKQTGAYKSEQEVPQGIFTNYIVAGNTENKVLNAHWMLETYTLTMRDLVNDTETLEFTVESSIEIKNPEWTGLLFAYWDDPDEKLVSYTDINGTRRAKIAAGTTGDIEVIAKWRSPANQVYANNLSNNLVGKKYDDASNLHWFMYELGSIEKVILGRKEDYVPKRHEGISTTYSVTKSVAITEETSKSIADMTSRIVSQSAETSKAISAMLGFSAELGMSLKTGAEAGAGVGIFSAKASIEQETSINLGVEAQLETTTTETYGIITTDESSQTVTNTFVYSSTVDYSQTEETTLDSTSPIGYYRNVNAATIKVYAVVLYDPATMTCYIDTYSVISEIYTFMMYERSGYVEYIQDSIPYAVDPDSIANEINSNYYVQYDTGVEGANKPIDCVPVDENYTIRRDFANMGHQLAGWEYRDANGEQQKVLFADGQTITKANWAEGGQTLRLKALWTQVDFTVTYDANGGEVSTASGIQTVGNKYTLLPIPTRDNCTFEGWYLNGVKVIDGETDVTIASDHTLVAKWTPRTTYSWNTGSREQRVTTSGWSEYWQTGMNREALREAGYTTITLSISMDGRFLSGDWFPADWWFEIYDHNNGCVVREDEKEWSFSWGSRSYQYTISIDAIRDDGRIYVYYDHGGDGADDFALGTIYITTVAN